MFRTADKYHALLWFYRRSVLPFILQLVMLAPLILLSTTNEAAAGYLFAAPLIVILSAIINLPFVASAFRSFRLDMATRRNHTLEHATILTLEGASRRRFNGRSSADGFRIDGRTSAGEIEKAFRQVCYTIRNRKPLEYVSPRCGSNTVTALGLSVSLLLLFSVFAIVMRPPLTIRAAALALVVVLFIGLRTRLGNFLQRTRFTAIDFDEVSLHSVRRVTPTLVERGPVHFVKTRVVAKHVSRAG